MTDFAPPDVLADGTERERLDTFLSNRTGDFDAPTRKRLWTSVDAILSHGPVASATDQGVTGLALGYVQSGKTTSIISLLAAGADSGYRVGIALLGSTNLLLDQNVSRIESALGLAYRSDYRWVLIKNPTGKQHAEDIANWLDRGRFVLLPVLKHAGRLDSLAAALTAAGAGEYPALIIDDEADQASLNTRVNQQDESRVYAAVGRLKIAIPRHLYVQYTATPYAPLLLEPTDQLAPEFVEMLEPGPGYTGGRQFFVDHAAEVVRPIPTLDEQRPKGLPTELPGSLITALGNFFAGAAILLSLDASNAPVSMLVHSTYKNDVQERYVFLIKRLLKRWRTDVSDSKLIPAPVAAEKDRLESFGAAKILSDTFLDHVRYVLSEHSIWLVNSATDVRNISWNVSPVHILVGGNKLDRGYTVEGLTVSYMNRPASPQIDTLEQRARAFGYRADLLPYCQFFAAPRTIEGLRGIVFTEYDLRAELEDWIAQGKSLAEWAKRIGLLLPPGTKPTRDAVITAVSRFNHLGEGWHSLRMPSLLPDSIEANDEIVRRTNIFSAPYRDYHRLSHRTTTLTLAKALSEVVEPWVVAGSYTPGWRHDQIIDFLRRHPDQTTEVPVIYLASETGAPRIRKWDPELGFVNLFQGSDLDYPHNPKAYPGDRNLFDRDRYPELIELQLHYVRPRDMELVSGIHTLAINLGRTVVVRKA